MLTIGEIIALVRLYGFYRIYYTSVETKVCLVIRKGAIIFWLYGLFRIYFTTGISIKYPKSISAKYQISTSTKYPKSISAKYPILI